SQSHFWGPRNSPRGTSLAIVLFAGPKLRDGRIASLAGSIISGGPYGYPSASAAATLRCGIRRVICRSHSVRGCLCAGGGAGEPHAAIALRHPAKAPDHPVAVERADARAGRRAQIR